MSWVIVIVGVLAGLGALIGAGLLVAGRRPPGAVLGALVAIPLVIAVVAIRVALGSAVHMAVVEGGPAFADLALGTPHGAWSYGVAASRVVVAMAAPVLLLAAIAGAMRGPRRFGRAAVGAVLTVLTSLAGAVVLLPAAADAPGGVLSSGTVVLASLIFGLLASVAFLGGGEEGGGEAAALAGVVAAIGIAAAGLGAIAFEQDIIATAAATAPPEMRGTLFSAGQSVAGWTRLLVMVSTVGAIGLAAVGLSGARSRVIGALAVVIVALELPYAALMLDPGEALVAGVFEARARSAEGP